jgi:hypothetical protein
MGLFYSTNEENNVDAENIPEPEPEPVQQQQQQQQQQQPMQPRRSERIQEKKRTNRKNGL